MMLNARAMNSLANELAFDLQDMRNEDTANPYADGVWAGIGMLLRAQALTLKAFEPGITAEPWKLRQHIQEQTKLAFAELFPHDYYPEDDE